MIVVNGWCFTHLTILIFWLCDLTSFMSKVKHNNDVLSRATITRHSLIIWLYGRFFVMILYNRLLSNPTTLNLMHFQFWLYDKLFLILYCYCFRRGRQFLDLACQGNIWFQKYSNPEISTFTNIITKLLHFTFFWGGGGS